MALMRTRRTSSRYWQGRRAPGATQVQEKVWCTPVELVVSRRARPLDPVVERIAANLANIDIIRIVKVSPGFIQASSEVEGFHRVPVTKPGHPTAVGVSLIPEPELMEVIFYEITSAVRGYGSRMVEAVMRALPLGWKAVVVMDWSDGFWETMRRRHKRLVVT